MKSWLKFFGLSFFSNKIAQEAKNRGFWNLFLGFLLTLVFVFCGLLASNVLPFITHYGNASNYQSFVQSTLEKLDLTVTEQKMSFNSIINTFTNQQDATQYASNGYNLVVDTRKATALDDFQPYCISKDGKEITYEAYLDLSEEERANYTFNIRYTASQLVLNNELVQGYEQFLSACDNQDLHAKYDKLVADKINLTVDEYQFNVYALYLQAYYPDITKLITAGSAPLLRNYYYINYVDDVSVSNYLLIFDDLMVGSFHTNKEMSVNFYGLYGKLPNGKVSADGKAFISSVFNATVPIFANVYLMNIFRYLPIILVIPLAISLLMWGALRAMKSQWGRSYSTCLKAVGAFLAFSALITALVMFVCGYFVVGNLLNQLPLIILSIVLSIRTAILLIYEHRHGKKIPAKTTDTEPTESTEAE